MEPNAAPSITMFGYDDVPGATIVTPGVLEVRVALRFFAVAQPVFVSRRFKRLHSFGLILPSPLPPVITMALESVVSRIGLAVPLRQTSRTVVASFATGTA